MALSLKIAATTLSAIVWCALMPAPAGAIGTISIQHRDGDVNTYGDVEIKVFSGSLFLTSDDGDGTIVITKAACSYRGQIIVCLPVTAALVQEGESTALNLKTGTIYLNYTDNAQPLSFSSAKIPADSVLVSLNLRNGTYINVRGKIDELIRQ
jgi:hypothetical protein